MWIKRWLDVYRHLFNTKSLLKYIYGTIDKITSTKNNLYFTPKSNLDIY